MAKKGRLASVKVKDPKDILLSMLKTTSGANESRSLRYNLFYRIIAFKGATSGVGCSTIVSNTAVALADLGLTVCVFDTSILYPIQDILLNTNYKKEEDKEVLDWFDMPFVNTSVLNISKIDKRISVLSFYGKERTILDMMGTSDNANLVQFAIDIVQPKFDIILMDLCDEPTEVNTACMQKAHHVIQVWSDSQACLGSIDKTITNNVLLSCPMDKMRYVVENNTCDDLMGSMDVLYKQYRFTKLTHCGMSYELARLSALGKTLFQYASSDDSVIEFTNCILDIVCHICNITDESDLQGTITSEDIEEGRVEGTLHNKTLSNPTVQVITPQSVDDLDKVSYSQDEGVSFIDSDDIFDLASEDAEKSPESSKITEADKVVNDKKPSGDTRVHAKKGSLKDALKSSAVDSVEKSSVRASDDAWNSAKAKKVTEGNVKKGFLGRRNRV